MAKPGYLFDQRYIWSLYTKYSYYLALADSNSHNKNLMTPGLFTEYFAIYYRRDVDSGISYPNHDDILRALAQPRVEYSNHPNMYHGAMDIYKDPKDKGHPEHLPSICDWS